MLSDFYKENENDMIWQVDELDESGEILKGPMLLSFDKKKIYNLWKDYPQNFTPEEVEIFKKEQPYWAEFFQDRTPV